MREPYLHQLIHNLVEEEHQLEQLPTDGLRSQADQDRIREVEVELDQVWDLLRQRDARRFANQDKDGIEIRPASMVEGYQQ